LTTIIELEVIQQKSRKTGADCRTDLRKHFSSERVVSLKEHTIQANDIISFKRHLEKERNTMMDLFMD